MAIKQAATRRARLYNGTHGNTAKEVFKVTLAADAAGTEIEMGIIPAGLEVTDLAIVTDNLGAGTNVDVGYRYVDPDNGSDDPDYWGNYTTAAAAKKNSSAKPVRFEDEVILVATLIGGECSGELIVMPEAVTRGTK